MKPHATPTSRKPRVHCQIAGCEGGIVSGSMMGEGLEVMEMVLDR